MGYSRLLLLVREGVRIDILDSCMSEEVPDIWVRIISKGRKSLVVGGVYREQHLILQPQPNNSDNPDQQLSRWKITLKNWNKAARNSKCVLIGDLNLNHLKWNNNNYRHHKLVQATKDEIETQGFCQLINKMTRFWPNTPPPSILDHIWTNSPGSILSTSNTDRAASDHNLLTATLRTKDRREQEHEIKKRDRKNLNIERYKEKMKNLD